MLSVCSLKCSSVLFFVQVGWRVRGYAWPSGPRILGEGDHMYSTPVLQRKPSLLPHAPITSVPCRERKQLFLLGYLGQPCWRMRTRRTTSLSTAMTVTVIMISP
ncbi:unnamed protein product [Prorocentrum cordatum]|uniref:Secreted protein n=1 Tax=Prorocentrum cordatum TaxID=2364126 RepID=A0ABN9Y339_9DINO|nr:unnamed protein product [Polarella glacialis]CAK0906899.1 unnamed protein product [Polarella glacialis]